MSEGRKDDGGKLRYDLIPAYPLHALAAVYTLGARKYDDRNWEQGLSWGRVFAAMMRHAWAWWRGEEHDPDDGQPHLASVAWCAFALLEYSMRRTGQDDRPHVGPPGDAIDRAVRNAPPFACPDPGQDPDIPPASTPVRVAWGIGGTEHGTEI